jgi:hypothetical protein
MGGFSHNEPLFAKKFQTDNQTNTSQEEGEVGKKWEM